MSSQWYFVPHHVQRVYNPENRPLQHNYIPPNPTTGFARPQIQFSTFYAVGSAPNLVSAQLNNTHGQGAYPAWSNAPQNPGVMSSPSHAAEQGAYSPMYQSQPMYPSTAGMVQYPDASLNALQLRTRVHEQQPEQQIEHRPTTSLPGQRTSDDLPTIDEAWANLNLLMQLEQPDDVRAEYASLGRWMSEREDQMEDDELDSFDEQRSTPSRRPALMPAQLTAPEPGQQMTFRQQLALMAQQVVEQQLGPQPQQRPTNGQRAALMPVQRTSHVEQQLGPQPQQHAEQRPTNGQRAALMPVQQNPHVEQELGQQAQQHDEQRQTNGQRAAPMPVQQNPHAEQELGQQAQQHDEQRPTIGQRADWMTEDERMLDRESNQWLIEQLLGPQPQQHSEQRQTNGQRAALMPVQRHPHAERELGQQEQQHDEQRLAINHRTDWMTEDERMLDQETNQWLAEQLLRQQTQHHDEQRLTVGQRVGLMSVQEHRHAERALEQEAHQHHPHAGQQLGQQPQQHAEQRRTIGQGVGMMTVQDYRHAERMLDQEAQHWGEVPFGHPEAMMQRHPHAEQERGQQAQQHDEQRLPNGERAGLMTAQQQRNAERILEQERPEQRSIVRPRLTLMPLQLEHRAGRQSEPRFMFRRRHASMQMQLQDATGLEWIVTTSSESSNANEWREQEPTEMEELGLTSSEMSRLRTYSFQPKNTNDDTDVCSCCLDEYMADESLRVLPCNHEFHSACVDVWLSTKRSCPLCRAIVSLDL